MNIDTVDLNPEILRLLPESFMRKQCVAPLRCEDNLLHIAVKDTRDFQIIDTARILSGLDVKAHQFSEKDIWDILGRYFCFSSSYKGTSHSESKESYLCLAYPDFDFNNAEESFSAIKWLDVLIEHAVTRRASDIHIEPQENVVFVRFRIDGMLITLETLPKDIQPRIISRVKVLAGMDIADRRGAQDGQFSCKILSRKIDFRVSSLPGKYGEKVVMRVLDRTSFALSLERLGFKPGDQARFEDLINKPHGIILVTGPTGSGKTSTLYASLNRLHSPSKNIITLEDPIEYELLAGSTRDAGITQVQVNAKAGLDFANGLRAILRQDPDVIMVGEIRDRETADIAMRAALTGHLVLSTLHTNDAPSSVIRLFDMGIEPFLVSSSLLGAVAQRLIRLLCPYCKEPYNLPARAWESFKKQTGVSEMPTLYRAKGCVRCSYAGYFGRRGVFELMVTDETVRRLILEKTEQSAIRTASLAGGMRSLQSEAMDLVMEGLTTMEEVYQLMV